MHPEEVLIPLTIFIATAAVLITWIYYRSKEKQMMIEKGMTPEQMIQFLNSRKKISPQVLLKIGIIIICFSVGMAIGLLVDEYGGPQAFVPFPIIFSIGLGFIIAYYIGIKKDSEL